MKNTRPPFGVPCPASTPSFTQSVGSGPRTLPRLRLRVRSCRTQTVTGLTPALAHRSLVDQPHHARTSSYDHHPCRPLYTRTIHGSLSYNPVELMPRQSD